MNRKDATRRLFFTPGRNDQSCVSLAVTALASDTGAETIGALPFRDTVLRTAAFFTPAFFIAGAFAMALPAAFFAGAAAFAATFFFAGAVAFFAIGFFAADLLMALAADFFAGAAAFFGNGFFAAAFFATSFAAAGLTVARFADVLTAAFFGNGFFAAAFFTAARTAIGCARGFSSVISSVLIC